MKQIFKTTEEFNKFIKDDVFFNENYTIQETRFYEGYITTKIYQKDQYRGISGAIIDAIIRNNIDIVYIDRDRTNNLMYITTNFDNSI